MIISIKPVGLLNTDNVRRIDGMCEVMVRAVMEKLRKVEMYRGELGGCRRGSKI